MEYHHCGLSGSSSSALDPSELMAQNLFASVEALEHLLLGANNPTSIRDFKHIMSIGHTVFTEHSREELPWAKLPIQSFVINNDNVPARLVTQG